MAILDGKVNVIRVKDKNGNLGQDRPIGALAENIAFGGATSNESVEQKINDLISSFDNLSTDKIKKEDKSLTEFLEEVITTSNKADAMTDTDDESFVTPKIITNYLTNKTNNTVSSTTEKPNNNLVTDNAVFEYVNSKITTIESKVPTAAESLDEAQGSNYVTVTLFNSKYIPMFKGNLTDNTIDGSSCISPVQAVNYLHTKYIGTVKDVYEERETGETDSDGNPIVENVFKGKKVIHKPLQDLVKTEEEEAALDINDEYFKGFVTPKQVIDYVLLQNTVNSGADAALRQYLGITGVDANGNLLPSQSDGKTILSRLNALEEAIKLNTTIN